MLTRFEEAFLLYPGISPTILRLWEEMSSCATTVYFWVDIRRRLWRNCLYAIFSYTLFLVVIFSMMHFRLNIKSVGPMTLTAIIFASIVIGFWGVCASLEIYKGVAEIRRYRSTRSTQKERQYLPDTRFLRDCLGLSEVIKRSQGRIGVTVKDMGSLNEAELHEIADARLVDAALNVLRSERDNGREDDITEQYRIWLREDYSLLKKFGLVREGYDLYYAMAEDQLKTIKDLSPLKE